MDSPLEESIISLPLPPPLKVITEPLDDLNANLPGGIKVSESGELLKSYITYLGFVGDSLNNYNNFIYEELPKQLRARPLRLSNGYLLYAIDVFADKPMLDEKVPLYPQIARSRNMTYSTSFYATFVLVYNGEEIGRYEKPVFIGKMPVMVGSKLCHLYNLTDEQKIDLGECPQDPLGYFIIKGIEKIIFIQEKLRVNRYLLFNTKKKGTVCRFTSSTSKGTSLIDLTATKKNSIRLSLHFMGKDNSVPVMLAFRVLFSAHGLLEEDANVLEVIMWFIRTATPAKYDKKVQSILQPSLLEVASIGDPYNFLRTLDPKEKTEAELAVAFTEELFPQIQSPTNKLFLLSLMISQFALYLAGLRKLDDRDSVSNKRFETGGVSLQQLFGALWNKTITDAEASIEEKTKNKRGAIREDNLGIVVAMIKFSNITDGLVSTFTQGAWGMKGSQVKNNITDILNRESIPSTYAQLTKINTPTRREAKQPHIRMVQMSQVGFIDFIETPEGRAVGLIKHKAVGAQSTPQEDDTIIIKQVLPLLKDVYSQSTPNMVLVNGKCIGWGMGEEIRRKVVQLRRKRTIPQFTSVVLHFDGAIYVSTDASRLSRPLLIVSDKDPNFTIYEEKELQGQEFTTLLEEGAVEFIDSMEQEHLYIAQSLQQLRKRRERLESILAKVTEARQLLHRLEGGAENKRALIPSTQIIDDMEVQINVSNLPSEEVELLYKQTLERAREELSLAENALNKATKEERPYTHVEMDPNSLLSISASLVPLPTHNMGPRNMYTCSMIKQALGAYHTNHAIRFDSNVKVLATPTPPIFQTQMTEWLGINELPAGDNIIVAICPYYGFNQEDAFVFNKASLQRGLFAYVVYVSYSATENKKDKDIVETFVKPNITLKPGSRDFYHALGPDGIAEIGREVKAGDVIISKTRRNIVTGSIDYENVRIGFGDEGVVDRVLVDRNEEGNKLVKVKTREVRISGDPIIGDKFASRYAQKGTIGLVVPPEDLPFTKDGMVPDIIINPLSIPSRMTIGKLFEIVAAKVGALRGERINASAFSNFDIKEFEKMLPQYGYESMGKEQLFSGTTGKPIPAEIFIGPCYYLMLRHLVKKKMQIRSSNLYQPVSHQPMGGRSKGGALRIGRMEANGFLSHGASDAMVDSFMHRSDAYETIFCTNCGRIATDSAKYDKPSCRGCGEGKEQFGRASIPFASRWLYSLLVGAGIELRFKFAPRETL